MTATTVTMLVGDVRDRLLDLAADGETFDLLVTSPPFLALRSYLPGDHPDKHREIGSEPTPAAFLDTMYGLTADFGRVLPEWASIAIELGDTMAQSGGAGGDYGPGGLRSEQPRYDGSARRGAARAGGEDGRPTIPGRTLYTVGKSGAEWPLAKSMCILPHAYALGLAYGRNPLTGTPSVAGRWRVRNVICWARPNPPVGSLGKRNPERRTGDYKFRPATSYITVACRGTGRYFDLDAVRTAYSPSTGGMGKATSNGPKAEHEHGSHMKVRRLTHDGAPPLDWHTDELDGDWLWRLATAPYAGSHFATFNMTLPRRLLLAMCPLRVCDVCGWPSERQVFHSRTFSNPHPSAGRSEVHHGGQFGADYEVHRDTIGWTDCGHDAWRPGHVLDPFGGSGTTAVAAALEGRDATLIDLDERNAALVDRRLHEALHVLGRHETPGRITWTVEAALPDQRHQLDGQMSFLDGGWDVGWDGAA